MKKVWVAGEVLVDLIPDSTGIRRPIVGGGGANTAKASALLGLETYFIDGISNDDFGAMSRRELLDCGIRLDFANSSSKPTATAEVTLDASGAASYRFNLTETATFDFHKDWLPSGEPDVLHFGTLATILAPGCEELLSWASAIAATKVFDPNIRPSVLANKDEYQAKVAKWLAISDVVKFSVDDMNWLYSLSGSESALVAKAHEVLDKGASLVVITLGEDGIMAITKEGITKAGAEVIKVADTVGAGDTVGAILIEAIANFGLTGLVNEHLNKTLSRATKAAAITCSRTGAKPPSIAELGAINFS